MELNMDDVLSWRGWCVKLAGKCSYLSTCHLSLYDLRAFCKSKLSQCSVLWLILGLSLVTLGFMVPIVPYWFTPLKGLRDPWRGGQRRGCLSFRTQYANIAGFQDELPVYRMAIINFFYRKLELSSGQLSYIIHLEIFILVPSQQILFTCIALCSFLLLFLAKFKYNRTVL